MPRAMTARSAKNILLVGNWRSDTGYAWKMIERFWIAIARAFPERRTYLCFPEVRAVNPDILAAGIEVEEFTFDFRHPGDLAQFCRKRDIELIYLTDRPYTSRVYSKLRRNGVRRIIVHDHTPGQRARPSAPKALLKKMAARAIGADAYIACSEQVLERFVTVGCLPRARCDLARNGIDLSQFPQPNPTIRAELSLSPETVLVVSCSRLHPYKRVHDIVDAAALLGDLDMHFIHIGDGPDHAPLQARIRERGLERRFTLLGARTDVAQVLSGCDIAVHASSGEVGLCLAILEFMATGLAVAVTDEPSVSRIIEPGVTGITFAHGNATALAESLRSLATDSDLRRRLGQAARKSVESQYHIEGTIASVTKAVRSTLSS
jgi:glycosyltransferase involved in cell wall biosynthesis